MRPRFVGLLAVLAFAAPGIASAAATTETEVPVTGPGFNPCTEEPFTYSGVMHVTQTDNHTTTHVSSMQAQTPTGVRYAMTNTFTVTSQDFDTFTSTHTITMTRISKNGTLEHGDDFRFHMTVRLVDGVPTVERTRSECV